MKVLVYQYESIYEVPIINFFERNGIKIDTIQSDFDNKGTTSGSTVEKIYKKIQDSLYANAPYLFVFSINFLPAISEICQKMNILYVSWTVDDPVLELFTNSIKNSCNRIFLFDRIQYERFVKYNPNCIFYLPLGGSPSIMDNAIRKIDETDKRNYEHDISFIGSLYSQSSPIKNVKQIDDYAKGYIDGIVNAQMNVYGFNFMESIITKEVVEVLKGASVEDNPQNLVECIDYFTASQLYLARHLAELERKKTLSSLADYFDVHLYTGSGEQKLGKVVMHPPVSSYEVVPKIYNLSKINLNITLRSIQSGLPLRIFDIISSGGFVMTNYQVEIPELFEIGREIEVYSSFEELKEKCEYYLTHEAERKEIARRGYDKLCSNHTVENRMKDMFSSVLKSM